MRSKQPKMGHLSFREGSVQVRIARSNSASKEQLCQHVPQAKTRSNCVSMFHKRKQGATVSACTTSANKEQPCHTRSRVMTNNRATQEAGS